MVDEAQVEESNELPTETQPVYEQRHYVKADGYYYGSYTGPDESMPSDFIGLTQVPYPPVHPSQRWVNGAWTEYVPPPPIYVIYGDDFWGRVTDEEGEAIDAVFQTKPLRIRKLWNLATQFRSDNELWPLLVAAVESECTPERAAIILVPSETINPPA